MPPHRKRGIPASSPHGFHAERTISPVSLVGLVLLFTSPYLLLRVLPGVAAGVHIKTRCCRESSSWRPSWHPLSMVKRLRVHLPEPRQLPSLNVISTRPRFTASMGKAPKFSSRPLLPVRCLQSIRDAIPMELECKFSSRFFKSKY